MVAGENVKRRHAKASAQFVASGQMEENGRYVRRGHMICGI